MVNSVIKNLGKPIVPNRPYIVCHCAQNGSDLSIPDNVFRQVRFYFEGLFAFDQWRKCIDPISSSSRHPNGILFD